MTARELHAAAKLLYGKGVVDWVYIRVLSRDLRIPERTVYRWWNSPPDYQIPSAQFALERRIHDFIIGLKKNGKAIQAA
ncbi:MAG: hypothetical protein HQL54_08905 [Magnetococcales bacterium]|nr:hypothetical protein [Magnetococcales bacterium]